MATIVDSQPSTNYQTPLGYAFNIKIETITPLHISSGSSLSPLGDYFIEGDKIYFIDKDKFSNLLVQKGKVNAFIERTQNVVDESKSGFLHKFFREEMGANLSEIQSDKSYKAHIKGNPVELSEFIKSDGRPFIPGSTLKGAISSTMFFKWLNSDQGDNCFIQWFNFFKNNINQSRRKKEIIDDIDREFRRMVEEKFFGQLNGDDRMVMACLKVSDSAFFKDSDLAAYVVLRSHLMSPEKTNIPSLNECIDINKPVKMRLAIDFDKIEHLHKIFPTALLPYTDPQMLCNMINENSRKVLNYEIRALDDEHVVIDDFGDHVEQLEQIKELIKEPAKNTAYLRLGHGKMQFYQTIAMKVYEHTGKDEQNDDWVDYLRYCEQLPNEQIPFVYPVTRLITQHNQMPLGWVKMVIK